MKYAAIDPTALAERLVAARKAAGITQETAAEHLKMSRPTFIAIEKGTRRPSPDEVVSLAKLYKLPLNTLLRDESRPAPIRPHLRSLLEGVADSQRELESAVALLTAYVDDYQHLEKLFDARPVTHFPPPVRIPPGSLERFAEHCAQEERARLKLGAHQPVDDLRRALEEAGLHVFMDALDSKLAGLYVFVPDFGYCILVNRQHPEARRRWTIAHEYGHFLVERDRPGVDYSKPPHRKNETERFSDSFATAFLMPEPGVQSRFYEEAQRTGDFKVGDLCRMAQYFGVSVMAMASRLESMGLIPRGSWDGVSRSRVPIRALRQEAGVYELSLRESTDPFPQRYKSLAVQAFVEGRITEGQLARHLRCSRIDARETVEQACLAMAEPGTSMPAPTLGFSLLRHAAV
jgi:Zn-dependent peptidase ImmA (M78 family)/DNA-binding XRE family transcriptional regulator